MFTFSTCFRWSAGIACLLGASGASADTLEFKNGDILSGTYMGGTQNTLRFETDSTIETVLVSEVLALTFGGVATSSAPPADAPALEPVSEYRPDYILAPAGTPLLVRMLDGIDSRQDGVGKRFAAVLEADFSSGDTTIAPRGSTVYGELVDANQAGRLKGKTWLVVELREIRIEDRLYPIVTGDYELRGEKSAGKRTAFTTLGGAALGAILGGDGDRGEGAAIGAGAGLAVSAIGKGEQIQIPSGTLIDFVLAQPFSM